MTGIDHWRDTSALLLTAVLGCNAEPEMVGGFGDGTDSATKGDHGATTGDQGSGSGASADTGSDGDSGASATETGDGGPKYDVEPGTTGNEGGDGGSPSCKVGPDGDASGECDYEAPPDSFDPVVQWVWNGRDGDDEAIVTPLVANLTDDNGDGDIDLCDVPDIVVVAYHSLTSGARSDGHIYVLDGGTGALHFKITQAVDSSVTPAIGDIDGDLVPEIVTAHENTLYAFEHDGTLKWGVPSSNGHRLGDSAIALADVDNDGDVEIAHGSYITDHHGQEVVTLGSTGLWSASALADLDGDGDQELVLTNAAIHHDGTWGYYVDELKTSTGYPQIADLDGDLLPEVLVAGDGISILEHDGKVKVLKQGPMSDRPNDPWLAPATIHDFDGDGAPEFAVGSGTAYSVWEADLTLVWSATVLDGSGDATGTAFDFLGDGIPEAMYGDEQDLLVFDGQGDPLLQVPRQSGTKIEYPTVADVDNDGSAEIVVVSNDMHDNKTAPTVQVIRDKDDRWVPARRIWNQHTYHVTNVREDGTIPQFEPPHWEHLNTYRTQAQIASGGGTCKPEPEG